MDGVPDAPRVSRSVSPLGPRPSLNQALTEKASPLAHNRCSKTASLRATAIAARFFAFFPPRSHSRHPYRRKSVSGPMVVKAAEGTWNVGVTIAGKVLSEALAKYYGLP